MLQGSLMYTTVHLNRYWRMICEAWVFLHGTVSYTAPAVQLHLGVGNRLDPLLLPPKPHTHTLSLRFIFCNNPIAAVAVIVAAAAVAAAAAAAAVAAGGG